MKRKGNINQYFAEKYSAELSVLEEPSIYAQKNNPEKNIFRFLWLRTFHEPIVIRLEIQKDETGILYIKSTSGTGGFGIGKIIMDKFKKIPKEEVKKFLDFIKTEKFWYLPTHGGCSGLDGSQWIIEGLSNSNYHIVDRWSPEKGHTHQIGMYFLKLSELNIEKIY